MAYADYALAGRPGSMTYQERKNLNSTRTNSTASNNTWKQTTGIGTVRNTGNTGDTGYKGNTGSTGSSTSTAAATTSSGMSAWQQAQSAILAAQNAAAEQLRAAQEAQRKAREEAYQKAAAQQKANYDFSAGQVNDATGKALQEAYINRMLQNKNLQQSLSAQGLNGGASETTTAGMYNNYNNARNDLETERQSQLASLLNTYQNNMAQLEQQRASGDAADLSQYQTALQNLTAGNTTNLISLLQGYGDMASSVPATTARYNAQTGQWEYV